MLTKKERAKKYYQENKEFCLRRNSEFYQTPKGRYVKYRSGARSRDIDFNISFEDFMEFWQQPCAYCGSDIETVGLDRMNGKVGYDKNNIIPCCSVCNKMKMNLTVNEFLNQCEKVANGITR